MDPLAKAAQKPAGKPDRNGQSTEGVCRKMKFCSENRLFRPASLLAAAKVQRWVKMARSFHRLTGKLLKTRGESVSQRGIWTLLRMKSSASAQCHSCQQSGGTAYNRKRGKAGFSVQRNREIFGEGNMIRPRTIQLTWAVFLASALLLLPANAANASTTTTALATTTTATGTNLYFGPTAAGSNDGSSCANAYAYNDSIHGWSQSAQQSPGNVLHVCPGTYTGSAGATAFTTVNSGTSGSPITLVCDQGKATFSAPYWSGSSGAWDVSQKYWVLNGDGNCTIANTQNGSGLKYAVKSFGVQIQNASNVTVEGLTVANICQHTSLSDTQGCVSGGTNDEAVNISSSSNVTVTKDTIHDAYIGVGVWPSGDSNLTISDNTISRTNWGIGGFNGGALSGIAITGNDISCVAGSASCNWDTTNDTFHHNGIIVFPQSATISGMVIANNYIHDINGYANGINQETAHIFLDPGGSGVIASPEIYNNVLTTTTGNGPSNAFISAGIDIGSLTGVTSAVIANNTLSGSAGWGMGSDTNAVIENNIVVGTQQVEYFDSGANGNTVNYNSGYGFTQGWASFGSLASWQGSSTSICSGGCDKNSITSNPGLNANYTLPSGSPAIGAGANLTSLGITGLDKGAPQTFGVKYACGSGCVSRPSTGNWTMGAYPSGSSSGSSSKTPSAPTGLTGTVQ